MHNIQQLLEVMARLRDPDKGCPWDREQSFASIVPHTIEEAYEVAEAVEHGTPDQLREELGDLLFQVVFYARLAEEQGAFGFDDVVDAIVDKLVRRHPHVFGDAEVADARDQSRAWEEHKARERAEKHGAGAEAASALYGVSRALPAVTRAAKLQKRAARVGFDWSSSEPVFAKIEEELGELRQELASGGHAERVAGETGDLLFACVNLARHLGVDPEGALRGTNAKFERRFRHIERSLAQTGSVPQEVTLDELDRLWEEAKRAEDTG